MPPIDAGPHNNRRAGEEQESRKLLRFERRLMNKVGFGGVFFPLWKGGS